MSDTSLNSTEEVRGLIRAGRAAVRVGDYEAARTTFERAVALDPGNQEALDGLRDAQRRLGRDPRPRGEEQVEYCYRHPDVETALHCTSCGRPICVRCTTPAAVGQLCPECRKGRRAPNYQISPVSLLKGGIVGLLVSLVAASLIGLIGGGFFMFIIIFMIGPAAAEMIVRSVDWATRNKRGRPMQITVALAMILGGVLAFRLVPVFLGFLPSPLAIGLFLLIGVGTAVARLR
ncbi:MAG TPA: tetratricopeptide repeat protein [Herpetosiphonaceae bacterium]